MAQRANEFLPYKLRKVVELKYLNALSELSKFLRHVDRLSNHK